MPFRLGQQKRQTRRNQSHQLASEMIRNHLRQVRCEACGRGEARSKCQLQRSLKDRPHFFVQVFARLARGLLCLFDGYQLTPHTTQQQTLAEGKRAVFAGWTANGIIQEGVQSFTVKTNLTLTAIYSIEYLVNATSPIGNVTLTSSGASRGSYGWFKEGGNITFQVDKASMPESGLLGSLGIRKVLQGWKVNGHETGLTATLTVSSPATIEAQWNTDYGIIPYAAILTPAIVSVAVVVLRRRLSTKSQVPMQTSS